MKLYRKIAVLTIIVGILFSLSSCAIPLKQKFKLGGNIEDITSIDIYKTENGENDRILNIRGEVPPTYTIPNSRINDFTNELTSLKYKWTRWLVPIDYGYVFSSGYNVVVEYNDGSCDVYAEHGMMLHGNYRPSNYCGSEPWNDFIEKYMQ
ncbi:MAG: hypothetical protein E7673_01885 [Ruminococcaceae bacterium]|nr:hypothetical protein [Oscillospiraceae bacterium]